MILAQLPTIAPGQLEAFLLAGAGACALVVLMRKAFARPVGLESEFVTREEFRIFRASVERELGSLRDRIDSRHLTMLETLEKLKGELLAAGEAREMRIAERLGRVDAAVARLDERTKTS